MTTQWISIRTVLSDLKDRIPAQFYNEQDVLEWCNVAMRKYKMAESLQQGICIIPIEDYKGDLPRWVEKIELSLYKLGGLSEEEIAKISEDILAYTGSQTLTDYFVANNQFAKWNESWRVLPHATDPFSGRWHCEDSLNKFCRGEYRYRISPDRIITTEFKSGYMAIAYWSYPTNDEGDLLIPDVQELIDSLSTYCLMRVWEKRMNMLEESAERMYEKYRLQWGFQYTKAVGKLIDSSVDVMERISNYRNQLVPRSSTYRSAFINFGAPQSLSF